MSYTSVEKTLTILSSFLPNNRGKGTVEISNETGIHVSTVSRLLQILSSHGYLQHDPRSKKYSLGKIVLQMAQAVHLSLNDQLVVIAQPFIDELRDDLKMDVALSVLINDSLMHVYRAQASQQNKIRYKIGNIIPFHATAGGKAILAFSAPELVDSLLKNEFIPLTSKTITDPDQFRDCLSECRKNGIATDLGEIFEKYYYIAAPVFNYKKKPVAAVNAGEYVNTPKEGFHPEIIRRVKDTAAKMSNKLFYEE